MSSALSRKVVIPFTLTALAAADVRHSKSVNQSKNRSPPPPSRVAAPKRSVSVSTDANKDDSSEYVQIDSTGEISLLQKKVVVARASKSHIQDDSAGSSDESDSATDGSSVSETGSAANSDHDDFYTGVCGYVCKCV